MVCNFVHGVLKELPDVKSRNPLTGLSGLQLLVEIFERMVFGGRNPLTGLSGLQRLAYLPIPLLPGLRECRNPLTGLSGLQLDPFRPGGTLRLSCRNPLTGLSGLQLVVVDPATWKLHLVSQSPYGAKWFATHIKIADSMLGIVRYKLGRNPLTGLSGLQHVLFERVTFGYPESQSPYGAKWFATRWPPKGQRGPHVVAIPLRG